MAKKKLTKKVVEDEVMEDPIDWEEFAEDEIEDIEEEVVFVEDIENPLFTKTVTIFQPIIDYSLPDLKKTFFDFTYRCCHPENGSHCIECYNKARKG